MDLKKEKKLTNREKLLKERNDCDIDNYMCLKCDSTFSSIKTLYFHMFSIHADTRVNYLCPMCKITFVQLWSVSRHLRRVHKMSKDEVLTLKSSIKTTFSTKTYKKWTQKNVDTELQRQMSVCKTMTCHLCRRDFSTPANLRRHLARHLGYSRYWCALCDYKTFDKSDCKDHIKRRHSVIETDKFVKTKK